jgi:ABC-2 type transport system permease protein
MLNPMFAVARRVLRQIAADPRALGLSLVAPLAAVFICRAVLNAFTNPFFEISPFVVPIGAFVVHFVTYVLCAIVLVRERSDGTLARMFVSGYRQSHIIGGYVLAYTVVATVQSLAVMIELRQLFHLAYAMHVLLSLYLVIWILAVISICLGICVSNFARTEGQVFPFIPLVTVPGIFLSGLIISVDQLPRWAQILAHITPLYYANLIIQQLIKPDGTLAANGLRVATLVLYGFIVMTLATWTLREGD